MILFFVTSVRPEKPEAPVNKTETSQNPLKDFYMNEVLNQISRLDVFQTPRHRQYTAIITKVFYFTIHPKKYELCKLFLMKCNFLN